MSVTAIILAGGSGQRFETDMPKQFIKVAGKPILEHTIGRFQRHPKIDDILIVTHPNYFEHTQLILPETKYTKLRSFVAGGKTRQESSYCGLKACPEGTTKVLIHDAVRPFVSDRILDDCIEALDTYMSVDVAIPSADTVIKVNEKQTISDIPKRAELMRGQTPQAFDYNAILQAHETAKGRKDLEVTDDCGLVVKLTEVPTHVVLGEEKNIKITYPEDLVLADKLFQMQSLEIYSVEDSELHSLEGQVIVVFGGTRGIGQKIVQLSEELGAKAEFCSRRTGCNISQYGDVSDFLKATLDKHGKIDHIVNTAAVLALESFEDKSLEKIQEEISVNYIGNINVAKAGLSYLKESQGSLLLFTSSSFTRGRGQYSLYSSSKAAVVNFVQALAEEYDSTQFRVNVMNPERSNTPMRSENFGKEPIESLLDPKVIARAALKVLASDFSGQTISVRRDEA